MAKLTNFISIILIVAAATVVTNASRNHIEVVGKDDAKINCLSWRLSVETGNLKGWKLVPQACKDYVAEYMVGGQHNADCQAATDAAYNYAKTLNLTTGKEAWVFDIDQTSLSLLPYYARSDVQFGYILTNSVHFTYVDVQVLIISFELNCNRAIKYNDTRFEEWLAGGTAPAVPAVLDLYTKLMELGIKIVFISGTSESQRNVRIANLKAAGYQTWEKLLLK